MLRAGPALEAHQTDLGREGPMRRTFVLSARAWQTLALVVAATLLAGVGTSYLSAEEEASVVKVHEEWELVVANPDADLDAPQITAVISPLGNLDGLYAAF